MVKVLSNTSTREVFNWIAAEISGYFDTKFNALGLIEPILHKFEDLKIANFLKPEEVYFLVTHIKNGDGYPIEMKVNLHLWSMSL